MERTSNYCTLASLVALIILVLFPVTSWCTEETKVRVASLTRHSIKSCDLWPVAPGHCCKRTSTFSGCLLFLFCFFAFQTKCCGHAALKRFDDIDYDSFVSLMGKRSAAPPNSELHLQEARVLQHSLSLAR